mmetsp:Transcript_8911/g.16208  ORF Transcript_8911/g.16208 Transcript_8911/m.16208 type:complete len:279 (-) Transcript_8911:68-904(-)
MDGHHIRAKVRVKPVLPSQPRPTSRRQKHRRHISSELSSRGSSVGRSESPSSPPRSPPAREKKVVQVTGGPEIPPDLYSSLIKAAERVEDYGVHRAVKWQADNRTHLVLNSLLPRTPSPPKKWPVPDEPRLSLREFSAICGGVASARSPEPQQALSEAAPDCGCLLIQSVRASSQKNASGNRSYDGYQGRQDTFPGKPASGQEPRILCLPSVTCRTRKDPTSHDTSPCSTVCTSSSMPTSRLWPGTSLGSASGSGSTTLASRGVSSGSSSATLPPPSF